MILYPNAHFNNVREIEIDFLRERLNYKNLSKYKSYFKGSIFVIPKT